MSAAPLALIEVLARDGSVRERHRVMHWPQRIGRAIDADLVLDDVHVAAEHLLLQPDAAGQLQAQALPSHNGLRLNRRRIAAGNTVALLSGQALEVGGTRLRVRMAWGPVDRWAVLAVDAAGSLAGHRPRRQSHRLGGTDLGRSLGLGGLVPAVGPGVQTVSGAL
jgi:hypothetical protein